jgi:hypothetical protein
VRLPAVLHEFWAAPVTTHTDDPVLRRVRVGLGLAWVIALVATCLLHAVPGALWQILLWLASAMLIASLANPMGWAKSMLLDWFPLYLTLVLYSMAWALASHLGIRPHSDPQLWFDQLLFGKDASVGRLQSALWSGSVHAEDYLLWAVYMSHFFVTVIVCAALWMRSRAEFLRYRRRVIGTWFAALVVFAAYPTVPPWMAAEQGHIHPLTRIIVQVWHSVAAPASALVDSPAAHASGSGGLALYNPVAAVPSMHAALPMLLTLYLWNRLTVLRPLLVAYPLAMGFVLVYSGEHFIFDILAGWACAGLVHVAFNRRERHKRDARHARHSQVVADAANHDSEPPVPVREPTMADHAG